MPDTESVFRTLGIGLPQSTPEATITPIRAAADASADVDPPTPIEPDDSEGDEVTLDDLMAGLGSDDAPLTAEAPDTQPSDDEEPEDAEPLSERERQLQARIEELEAREREAEAEDAEYQWTEDWRQTFSRGEAQYGDLARQWAQIGREQGWSDLEIEGIITRNVLKAMIVPDGTPHGRYVDKGFLQWRDETQANFEVAKVKREKERSLPSTLDALVTEYGLTPEDRKTLSRFIDRAPEDVQLIAEALGAKRAAAKADTDQIKTDARAAVKQKLGRNAHPGVPSHARPTKNIADYQFKGGRQSRQETEAVMTRIMPFLRTGT